MAAFVKRILLEEGAPRIIRCDNCSEFKNKTMNELRLLMRAELQLLTPTPRLEKAAQ